MDVTFHKPKELTYNVAILNGLRFAVTRKKVDRRWIMQISDNEEIEYVYGDLANKFTLYVYIKNLKL